MFITKYALIVAKDRTYKGCNYNKTKKNFNLCLKALIETINYSKCINLEQKKTFENAAEITQ